MAERTAVLCAQRAHGPDQPNRCRTLAGEIRDRPPVRCAPHPGRVAETAREGPGATVGVAGQAAATAEATESDTDAAQAFANIRDALLHFPDSSSDMRALASLARRKPRR